MAKKPKPTKKQIEPKVKNDTESLLLPSLYFLSFFVILFIILNSAAAAFYKYSHIKSAFKSGYQYAPYIIYDDSLATIMLFIFAIAYGVGLGYLLVIGLFEKIANVCVIIGVALPIIFYMFHYESIEKYMYPQINNLYNLIKVDQAFTNSPLGIKFKRAIDEKDYTTLKELSNNLPSLAKVPQEKLNEMEAIINVIPVTELETAFREFKRGYVSYAEYDLFYEKAWLIFNQSDYKNNEEFSLLMKKLKIITYDYNQLKTNLL